MQIAKLILGSVLVAVAIYGSILLTLIMGEIFNG